MNLLNFLKSKTFLLILIIILFFIVSIQTYIILITNQSNKKIDYNFQENITEPPDNGQVKRVIDPITIELVSGHIIRYVGVRNPDVTGEIKCFGKEAMLANESMIGKKIRIETEPLINKSTDGAWLRYVFIEDIKKPEEGQEVKVEENKPKEIIINERILEMGLGFPLVSQEMKYGERMLSASKYASATKKGLWGQCIVDSKKTANGIYFSTQTIDDCVIKAETNIFGEKIYRTPSCLSYKEMIVIQSEGDKWFCSEDMAKENGFFKAKDCK